MGLADDGTVTAPEGAAADAAADAGAAGADAATSTSMPSASTPSGRLVDRLRAKVADGEAFFSFEFFPPASERGQHHLHARVDSMAQMRPLFVDVTTAGGGADSLALCKDFLRFFGVDVMMHVSCVGLTRSSLVALLREAKAAGICNLLALHGDDPGPQHEAPPGELQRAIEIVVIARKEFGDFFTIAVAGYPEGLGLRAPDTDTDTDADADAEPQADAQAQAQATKPDSSSSSKTTPTLPTTATSKPATLATTPTPASAALPSSSTAAASTAAASTAESAEANYWRHIDILKAKVDAGADLCLTQAFFDTSRFVQFVADCRARGVPRAVAIVPGLLPIQGYASFRALTRRLGLRVPPQVMRGLEAVRGDKAAVQRFGIELAARMGRELLASGAALGLHFYTFNLEHSVRRVVERELRLTTPSSLPWRPSADPKRLEEDVRPIFWANRPKSYLVRTEGWEQYPSGRWGDALGSELFATLQESDLLSRDTFFERNDIKRKAWGEAPLSEEEVFAVFADFIEGSVPFLPWCDESLHLESSAIKAKLVAINRAGFLTINSQPRVNAAPSSHASFGWGPAGASGYVYQKAYIEFFTSPAKLRTLMHRLQSPEPDFAGHSLVFHAVDAKGNTYTNAASAAEKKPCAVTWGVFPGREVLQPTVVDQEAFLVWKDEAFALWVKGWASIYDEDSPSYDLLYDVHDQYFLVNIVDNNFLSGDIFSVFDV